MDDDNQLFLGLPDSKTLLQWWQEAEQQIKLAHPHESPNVHSELIKRYVQLKITKYCEKQGKRVPPNLKIAEWYQEELLKLRESRASLPLKIRKKMAANTVKKKIEVYRKSKRLEEFF